MLHPLQAKIHPFTPGEPWVEWHLKDLARQAAEHYRKLTPAELEAFERRYPCRRGSPIDTYGMKSIHGRAITLAKES
jgi:hypothetical protein